MEPPADVTQAHPAQFRNPTLKRHNPRTVRKNTGDDYHGCLRVDVRRSVDLYRKIEGWATAAMQTSMIWAKMARSTASMTMGPEPEKPR
jgi:hypothetical protein